MNDDVSYHPLPNLLLLAEAMAIKSSSGHLTLMRFSSGWKVMLGTPQLDDDSREVVWNLKACWSLELALRNLIDHSTGYAPSPVK